MKTKQVVINDIHALPTALTSLQDLEPQWVIVFGATSFFTDSRLLEGLRTAFPNATLSGCSTAGEISQRGCNDHSCVITAVHFETTQLIAASTVLQGMEDSRAAGMRLGQQLNRAGLKAAMVFGPGVQINGSALVEGIAAVIGEHIPLTGGLGGDGGAFQKTWTLGPTGCNDQTIVAIGLYGEHLRFQHGSFGGWEPFGPARKVTRCEGNILFELDGAPALDVYKRYLGDYARELPASGLLFPFAMLGENHDEIGLIRTILGVSETDGSLTLAGEINADGYLKLMHANTDSLVHGAEKAAEAACAMGASTDHGLAILVSCVGRKLVMGERVDEEIEAIADVFGQTTLTGFYSYGEISPFAPGASCKLHNQTMTVTLLDEA